MAAVVFVAESPTKTPPLLQRVPLLFQSCLPLTFCLALLALRPPAYRDCQHFFCCLPLAPLPNRLPLLNCLLFLDCLPLPLTVCPGLPCCHCKTGCRCHCRCHRHRRFHRRCHRCCHFHRRCRCRCRCRCCFHCCCHCCSEVAGLLLFRVLVTRATSQQLLVFSDILLPAIIHTCLDTRYLHFTYI